MIADFENYLEHIELEVVHCQSENMESKDGANWLLISAVCIAGGVITLNFLATFGYYLVKRSLPSNSCWKNVLFRLTSCFHLGGNVRKQFEQKSSSKSAANVFCSNHFHGCKAILVGLIVFENCRVVSEATSVLQTVLLSVFFFICGLVKVQSLTSKQHNLTFCLFTWLKLELLVCFVILCAIFIEHLNISFRFTENSFLSELLLRILLIDNFFYNVSFNLFKFYNTK